MPLAAFSFTWMGLDFTAPSSAFSLQTRFFSFVFSWRFSDANKPKLKGSSLFGPFSSIEKGKNMGFFREETVVPASQKLR